MPNEIRGRMIGRGGGGVMKMEADSGAKIDFVLGESAVVVSGPSEESVEKALKLLSDQKAALEKTAFEKDHVVRMHGCIVPWICVCICMYVM